MLNFPSYDHQNLPYSLPLTPSLILSHSTLLPYTLPLCFILSHPPSYSPSHLPPLPPFLISSLPPFSLNYLITLHSPSYLPSLPPSLLSTLPHTLTPSLPPHPHTLLSKASPQQPTHHPTQKRHTLNVKRMMRVSLG